MKCACDCTQHNHIQHEHPGGDDGCDCGHDHEEELKRSEKICLVASGILIAVSLVFDHLLGNPFVAMVLSFAAIAAGLVIVLPETGKSLKARSIDINVLLIVAIIGAVYVRAYEEAAAVLFLFSVGEYLEGRAMRKSSDAIEDLARLAPDTTLVVRDGQTIEIATDEVCLGEIVALRPGMSAPLDGIIVKGSSAFNDAAITGESAPIRKTVGDKVFAASLSVDGACEFETISTVADSTLAKIAAMVQDAQKQKSQRESFVQRFARIYTPLVIVLALLVAFVPPLLSMLGFASLGDLNTWIYRACELLVISCPCAFVISTPVTIVSALTRAAKIGVLVKGGAFFEEGARVQVVAFDKTGTLTLGAPTITDIVVAPGAGGEEEVLRIAAALEVHSTHPLAHAVVKYVRAFGFAEMAEASDVQEQAGKGVSGTVDGVPVMIGSKRAVVEQTGLVQAAEALAAGTKGSAGTMLYLARTDALPQLLGVFVVADAIRPDTPATIAALHATAPPKRIVMLTGDNAEVARVVGMQAGVDEVEAGLLPEDKTVHIRRLISTYGPVVYVGDGINDAPSLATANVGIAMGGAGSDAALSSADVVLMADDLSALPKFFLLSTKTVSIIRQNVVLAIGLKLFVALLVVFGLAQMWMAVLADTGVSLLVILNGMRLLRVSLRARRTE
ncbi:MAG: cation-translocating P-type ATPase [Raoultibacter sp.]